jgi:hypothetical protein
MNRLTVLLVGAAATLVSACADAPSVACGEGTRLEGERCLPATSLQCGAGTRAEGDACVPDESAQVECGAGTRLEDGQCVPTFGCPEGTHLEGAACVKDAPPATWSANIRVSDPGVHASNPVVAADADGHVWVALIETLDQIQRVVLYDSNNEGATWTRRTAYTPTYYFSGQPSLVATQDGKVFLAWTDFTSATQQAYTSDILFVSSDDHGVTWSQPKKLNAESATYNDNVQLTLGQGSVLHAHFFSQLTQNAYRTQHIVSTNHGATWSSPVSVPEAPPKTNDYTYSTHYTRGAVTADGVLVMPEVVIGYYSGSRAVGFLTRPASGGSFERTELGGIFSTRSFPVEARPQFAASPNGRNCFAYVDAPNRDFGVFVTTAQDSLAFGKAARVDTGAGSVQMLPGLAADPEGRCHLVWLDNRSGEWEVWGATVRADGTFSRNERVSDATFVEDGTFNLSLGNHIGLAVGGTTRFAAWTDTRDFLSGVFLATSPLAGP